MPCNLSENRLKKKNVIIPIKQCIFVLEKEPSRKFQLRSALQHNGVKVKECFLKMKERFLKIKERFLKIKERFLKIKECFLKMKERFLKIKERFLKIKDRFLKMKERFLKMKEGFLMVEDERMLLFYRAVIILFLRRMYVGLYLIILSEENLLRRYMAGYHEGFNRTTKTR